MNTLQLYKYDELPPHAKTEWISVATHKDARFVFMRGKWYATFIR
jgi:hypothetical protein